MTSSINIAVIMILSLFGASLIFILRRASLHIFQSRKHNAQVALGSSLTTPKRTISETMKNLVLPYHLCDRKLRFFLSMLTKQHFALSCLLPLQEQYSQRITMLLFSIVHFLTSLSICSLFVFNAPSLSQCLQQNRETCGRGEASLSLTSLHQQFCSWSDHDNQCKLSLSFGSLHHVLPLILLQVLFISLCQAPMHSLMTYCAEQIHLLLDYHLFSTAKSYNHRTIGSRNVFTDSANDEEKQATQPPTQRSFVMLIDYNDEFITLQTNHSLLLRGIRLSVLQRKIDFVRPTQELDFLLNKERLSNHFLRWQQRPESFVSQNYNFLNFLNFHFNLLQYRFFTVSGDPADIHSFLSHCHHQHSTLVLRHLLATRQTTQLLYNELKQLPASMPLDYQERDQQLLQYFLIYWQSGLSQEILRREYSRMTYERQQRRFLSSIFSNETTIPSSFFSCELYYSNLSKCFLLAINTFVVALVAAETAYLVYVLPVFLWEEWTHASDDNDRLVLWFWVTFAVFEVLYLFWILPLITAFYELFLPRFINPTHSILLQTLSLRMKHILLKRSHYLSNIFSTIQFFHPIVRLARLLPTSAVSRVFFTLNDNDLPIKALFKLRQSTHPIYKIWKLEYSNLRENIWSEENPLLRHRLQLLLDNWKIRAFYFCNQVSYFVEAFVRLMLYAMMLLPHACLQKLLLEVIFSLVTFGGLLLITFHWRRNFVAAIIVLATIALVFFACMDVCFSWSKLLWRTYFSRLEEEYQQVLKYRKKVLKASAVKVYPTSST